LRSRIPKSELDLLSRVPLFAGCSANELRAIAKLGTPIDVESGHVLTKEGSAGGEFFLLVEGTASCRGKGTKGITLRSGDYFGELSLLDGNPRSATVTATSQCFLIVFTNREFVALLRASPAIALKMLVNLSLRLRAAEAAATH
jgi:CRP/FNR family cyclic AMP-dependent transcriptional regulator